MPVNSMRFMRRVALLCAAAALFVSPLAARAAVIARTPEQLAAEADAIVLVQVGTARASRMPAAGLSEKRQPIFSDYTLRTVKTVKGRRPASFVLRQPGGEIAGEGQFVSELPRFTAGERCYLFLDANDNVIGGWQGKLPDSVQSASIVDRAVGRAAVRPAASRGSARVPAAVVVPTQPTFAQRAEAFWDPATAAGPFVVVDRVRSTFDAGTTGWTLAPGAANGAFWSWTGSTVGTNTTGKLYVAGNGNGTVPGFVPGASIDATVQGWADMNAGVSLSGYNAAWLEFDYWSDCSSYTVDYACAIVATHVIDGRDPSTEYWLPGSFTDQSTGGTWRHVRLDLRAVSDIGAPGTTHDFTGKTVYVTFFGRDTDKAGGTGIYLDNVAITADNVTGPTITGITPAHADCGIGSTVTISGSGFGATRGTGEVRMYEDAASTLAATVVSWSDTSIVCVVPEYVSSGPVIVKTGDGLTSAGFTYAVGFSYGGLHVATPARSYRINENTTQVAGEGAVFQAAMADWNGAPYRRSNFTFGYAGSCTTTANNSVTNSDGNNDIYFAPGTTFSSTSILAWNWFHYSGTHITQSDIVFNDSQPWSIGPAMGHYDLKTVAMHEMGHTLCLDDQYGSLDAPKLMRGVVSSNATKGIGADDLRGLIYIYGKDVAAPAAPAVSSSTHPDPATWYANAGPAFAFSATDASGVYGYAYAIDGSPTTDPGTSTVTTTGTTATLAGQPDGLRYFHVRAVDTFGNWGPSAHLAVRIDTHPLSGDFVLAGGASHVHTTTVSLSSGVTNAVVMAVSVNGGSSFAATQTYAPSITAVLPSGDGTKTVTVRYANAAGNTLTATHEVLLASGDPFGTVVVNGGAPYTRSKSVIATVTFTGTSFLRFNSGAGWTAYEPATSTPYAKALTLQVVADGTATVLAEFSAAGLPTHVDTATIVYDATPPSTGCDALASYPGTATVHLTPVDALSGIAGTRWTLDAGSVATSGTTVTVSAPGTHTLYYSSEDGAGNREPTQSAVFFIDGPPSTSATVTPAPNGWNGWHIGSFPAVRVIRDLAGTTYARWDTTSTWQTSAATTTTADPPSSTTGTRTLTYYGVSSGGATETPPHSLVVRYDGIAPAGSFTVNGGTAPTTTATAISVDASMTDTGSGPGYMRVGIDGSFAATTPFTPHVHASLPASAGPHAVEVRFWDLAGNADPVSHVVTVTLEAVSREATRVGGADRYVVAADLARRAFPGWAGVSTVIIACGSDRAAADPLGAAGLSGAANAPILLVRTDKYVSVPTPTTQALIGIAAANGGAKPAVLIVGGPVSVTTAQVNTLRAYASTITRFSGADRYAVAANVAAEVKRRNGGSVPIVLIAAGNTPTRFWEPLALGPIAARMKAPILLVKGSTVPAATTAALSSLGVSGPSRYLGAHAAIVSEAARVSLGVPIGNRIAGADTSRESFAAAVAEASILQGWFTGPTRVGVTNALADSLGGGAAMGRLGGPVLYTSSAAVPWQTSAFITAHASTITSITVVGGPTSVRDDVVTALRALLP